MTWYILWLEANILFGSHTLVFGGDARLFGLFNFAAAVLIYRDYGYTWINPFKKRRK